MASEAIFLHTLARVLDYEGGYVNDPADPGGETNFGITKRSYPDIDIRSLTSLRAGAIYREDYWRKPRFDQLPDEIAGAVFDIGVNMGPREATILLQDALILCGHRVTADGVIGPQTITATLAAEPFTLIGTYRWRVVTHYLDIVAAKPSSRKFLGGWLRRACSLA